MKDRIIGFDLARAYAIFGMYIVNFNTVFGGHNDHHGLSGILNLFNGNSSSIFVMLAGMGVSLMTNRPEYSAEMKKKLRTIVIRRSWFLFVVGMVLYTWWPADILHFYGGYLHIAALLLFVPKKYLLWCACGAIAIFHALLYIIPFETGWDFDTLRYIDFWTLEGFLRNTFYNGWNPIFPWLAYFLLGMFLGRQDWQQAEVLRKTVVVALVVWVASEGVQLAGTWVSSSEIRFYLTADYLPPFLPIMLSTGSFGVLIISASIYIGSKAGSSSALQALVATGQMTLTHYLLHLLPGMILLGWITNTPLESEFKHRPIDPIVILLFAIFFFVLSVVFSVFWSKRFRNGPMETVMRKFSQV